MRQFARGVLGPALPRALPVLLVLFVASAYLLPSGPAYSLVFYVAVLPVAVLAGWRGALRAEPGWGWAAGLILWSGLTLLWGHDDGHRSWRFAADTAMTLVFVAALADGFRTPASRRALAGVLIWAGAANAVLSVGLAVVLPQHSDRLHGWGATSHPILGASVMTVAYLAALCRALTERRWWAAHLAAAGAMAVFLVLTESRGPWLAASLATLFLCAAGPWRWRALGGLAALALAWWLLPGWVRHHQADMLVARGSSHRFEIWNRTWQLIRERPLAGHGLAANLDLPGITFPHDLYLSVLFYSGAVGGMLFASLVLWVTWTLWQGRRERTPEWLWMVSIWAAVLIAGLTDLGQITKGPGPMWFIFWLPVGLVLAKARPGALSPGHRRLEPIAPAAPARSDI